MSLARLTAIIVPLALFTAPVAYAQDAGAAAGPAAGGADVPPPGGDAGGDVQGSPSGADAGAAAAAAAGQGAIGAYAPRGGGGQNVDVNSGLDAGTRPASAGGVGKDGFTFQTSSGGGTVRGGQNGAYVVSGQYVPELHTAKRGDTLWEVSQRYFGNAYNWPRLWAYNRQIQNPHWIYPGDHIRLREPFVQHSLTTAGLTRLNPQVPPSAVFQRHVGFLLDGKTPAWGDVVGSPDDQMILTQEDEIYVQLVGERDYQVGQKLIVFEPRQVEAGTEYPHVWIRGIIEIDRYNPKTKMARAKIVEAMSEIHRGCKVAPYERNLDTVTPVINKRTVQARIVGALHPYEFYAKNQVVFIDKGTADGLEVGNRLLAVQRVDRWRRDVASAGVLGTKRSLVEDDRAAQIESPYGGFDPEAFPAETYGELIVTRVREHTATCLIIASSYEIPRNATLLAREGY